MPISSAPSPGWSGLVTSFASRMAPAQVPKVGFTRTNCLSFSNPCSPRIFRNAPDSPPGNDEAVDFDPVARACGRGPPRRQFFEALAVGVKIALDGEDSDFHKISS